MSAMLALLFGLIALIYASVGFGGGSSYTALLTFTGIESRLIPVISLCCNIIVVTGGTIRRSQRQRNPLGCRGEVSDNRLDLGLGHRFMGRLYFFQVRDRLAGDTLPSQVA